MKTIVNDAINQYVEWLKSNMHSSEMDDGSVEITVPFLNVNNDHFRFYFEKTLSGYRLTDIGETLNELELSGLRLTQSRLNAIQEFARSYGVVLNKSDQSLSASFTDLKEMAVQQHRLTQAMIHIDDMFLTTQRNVKNFFKEDVSRFFRENDIFPVQDISRIGKSGLPQPLDFIIPATKNTNERIIQLVNSPRKDRINNAIFVLSDVISGTKSTDDGFVFVNDSNELLVEQQINAIKAYNFTPLLWSDKNTIVDALKQAM